MLACAPRPSTACLGMASASARPNQTQQVPLGNQICRMFSPSFLPAAAAARVCGAVHVADLVFLPKQAGSLVAFHPPIHPCCSSFMRWRFLGAVRVSLPVVSWDGCVYHCVKQCNVLSSAGGGMGGVHLHEGGGPIIPESSLVPRSATRHDRRPLSLSHSQQKSLICQL